MGSNQCSLYPRLIENIALCYRPLSDPRYTAIALHNPKNEYLPDQPAADALHVRKANSRCCVQPTGPPALHTNSFVEEHTLWTPKFKEQ